MKKVIMSALVAITIACVGFSETIHVKKAYAMKKWKDDGRVYVIRVFEDGEYKDWYVIQSKDKTNVFYGYDDGVEIIVDQLIDIAVID